MRVSEGYTDKLLTKACDFSLPVKSDLTLYAKWEAKSQSYAILYKDGLLSLQAGPDTDPSRGSCGVFRLRAVPQPCLASFKPPVMSLFL